MSSPWRMRLDSFANISSRRFFSRMTVWDFCGFDQRLGSEACFSISLRRWRRLPASKILPKFADFVFQRRVFLFELFDHYVVLSKTVREPLSARAKRGIWVLRVATNNLDSLVAGAPR